MKRTKILKTIIFFAFLPFWIGILWFAWSLMYVGDALDQRKRYNERNTKKR